MKGIIKNIILLAISIVLLLILAPVGLLFTLLVSITKEVKGRQKGVKKIGKQYLADSMLDNAISLDIFGNVICSDLLNVVLLKSDSEVLFGNPRLTVSGVLGLNQEHFTLTILGIVLGGILDLIDEDHLAKAADKNRPYINL